MIGLEFNQRVQTVLAPLIGQITDSKKNVERDSMEYQLYQHAGNALICTALGIESQCAIHDNYIAQQAEAGKQPETA